MGNDDKPKRDSAKEVQSFHKQYKLAQVLADTTEKHHSDAYSHAENKVLLNEKKQVEIDRLNDTAYQNAFIKEMFQYYLDRANEALGTKIKAEDQVEADRIVRAYANIAKADLIRAVKTHKNEYTRKLHETRRDELVKKVRQELTESATNNLQDEDIATLLKGTALEKEVDPKLMRLEDAVGIYINHIENGGLNREQYENNYKKAGMALPTFLKPKKKEPSYSKAA